MPRILKTSQTFKIWQPTAGTYQFRIQLRNVLCVLLPQQIVNGCELLQGGRGMSQVLKHGIHLRGVWEMVLGAWPRAHGHKQYSILLPYPPPTPHTQPSSHNPRICRGKGFRRFCLGRVMLSQSTRSMQLAYP
jgi:hypothetical protein